MATIRGLLGVAMTSSSLRATGPQHSDGNALDVISMPGSSVAAVLVRRAVIIAGGMALWVKAAQ